MVDNNSIKIIKTIMKFRIPFSTLISVWIYRLGSKNTKAVQITYKKVERTLLKRMPIFIKFKAF